MASLSIKVVPSGAISLENFSNVFFSSSNNSDECELDFTDRKRLESSFVGPR